jgi:hypothetical protein
MHFYSGPPLHFLSGVDKPLRRNRRARLEDVKTGYGRTLPAHLKAQISRELDRLELLLVQIKAVETERDAWLAAEQTPSQPAPARDVVGPERRRAGVRGGPLVGGALPTF